MNAIHMVHNSYLEAQFMIDLVFFLTFPICVGLPYVFSNFSSESGVRVDIDRFQIFIKLTSGKMNYGMDPWI